MILTQKWEKIYKMEDRQEITELKKEMMQSKY